MAQAGYTTDRLLQIGRANYDQLCLFCENLERSGLWEQARQVMKQSAKMILDRYVQSVLVTFAAEEGSVSQSDREYIAIITDSNPLAVSPEVSVTGELIEECRRFCGFPPVLLQLCAAYDDEYMQHTGEQFLDSFVNIILCMAYMVDRESVLTRRFVRDFYDRVSVFVDTEEYLFHKLYGTDIIDDTRWLHVPAKLQSAEAMADSPAAAQRNSERNVWQEIKGNGTTERMNVESDAGQGTEDDGSTELLNSESGAGRELKGAGTTEQISTGSHEQQDKLEEQLQQEMARKQFQAVKKRIQEREEAERKEQEERLQRLLDELNALVGLQGVKDEIQSLVNLIRIRKLRETMGLPQMDMSYHMVFTGAPGTGKTTVARLVAKIYRELGILSKGTFIETDRSGLVAGYVGQTALKVHELVEQAVGGILFIDEAYALVNPDVPNDFGMEAVDTLVKLMEDHRDDLIVIVAGYTEEMQAFLKCNTGLVSRFNKFIDFPDYSKEELIAILDAMADKAGLQLEESAREAVLLSLQAKTEEEWNVFGNARGIRNLFEKIVMNQANRLVRLSAPSREDLMKIQREDVEVV